MIWENKRWITIGALALMVIFFGSCQNTSGNEEAEGQPGQSTRIDSSGSSLLIHRQIILLKDSLRIAQSPEKKANFASRLSDNYVDIDKSDSAAYFDGVAAESFPNEENLFEAGKQYFNAYSVEVEAQVRIELAEKSESYLLSLLESYPDHIEGRVLLGVLYLTSERLSEGTELLREVLIVNPDHQEANFNLGVHALQVGAFEPASKHFESIVQQDTSNVQSTFYLALCYQQLGRKNEAVELLKKVKELDSSPEVQANADAYLNDIE